MNLTYECLKKINPDFDFKGRDNTTKKKEYDDKERKEAIALAKKTSAKEAAIELGIAYGTLSTWITKSKKLKNIKVMVPMDEIRFNYEIQ